MANATFLELTNEVLNTLNEKEISSADFSSAKGIFARAKRSVNNALSDIYSRGKSLWPFNTADGTQTLVVGQTEYSLPSDFKTADWNSFFITKNDSLGVGTVHLEREELDRYQRLYQEYDKDNTTEGIQVPRMVVPKLRDSKFIVSPSPDQTYEVTFEYFKRFVPLNLYTDQTDVPEEYNTVIVARALVFMNYFMDNNEQADLVLKAEFEPFFENMRMELINDEYNISDTRSRNINHVR